MRSLALALVLVASCAPSAADAARATILGAALASDASDRAFAAAYQRASEAAREQSATQAERDARMGQWDDAADRLEELLGHLNADLLLAEQLVDAGDAGDASAILQRIEEALVELVQILDDAGVDVPDPLRRWARAPR